MLSYLDLDGVDILHGLVYTILAELCRVFGYMRSCRMYIIISRRGLFGTAGSAASPHSIVGVCRVCLPEDRGGSQGNETPNQSNNVGSDSNWTRRFTCLGRSGLVSAGRDGWELQNEWMSHAGFCWQPTCMHSYPSPKKTSLHSLNQKTGNWLISCKLKGVWLGAWVSASQLQDYLLKNRAVDLKSSLENSSFHTFLMLREQT